MQNFSVGELQLAHALWLSVMAVLRETENYELPAIKTMRRTQFPVTGRIIHELSLRTTLRSVLGTCGSRFRVAKREQCQVCR